MMDGATEVAPSHKGKPPSPSVGASEHLPAYLSSWQRFFSQPRHLIPTSLERQGYD